MVGLFLALSRLDLAPWQKVDLATLALPIGTDKTQVLYIQFIDITISLFVIPETPRKFYVWRKNNFGHLCFLTNNPTYHVLVFYPVRLSVQTRADATREKHGGDSVKI